MSLFDRLFRRRRGGAPGDARSSSDPNAIPFMPNTQDDDHGRNNGHVDASIQQIQVGDDESSQQVDAGDPDAGDSGGGDSGGGDSGGDGGGGGGE